MYLFSTKCKLTVEFQIWIRKYFRSSEWSYALDFILGLSPLSILTVVTLKALFLINFDNTGMLHFLAVGSRSEELQLIEKSKS